LFKVLWQIYEQVMVLGCKAEPHKIVEAISLFSKVNPHWESHIRQHFKFSFFFGGAEIKSSIFCFAPILNYLLSLSVNLMWVLYGVGRMRQLGYTIDLAVFNFCEFFLISDCILLPAHNEHLNCLMHPLNIASGKRLFPIVKLS
jgi:hypothetical protein